MTSVSCWTSSASPCVPTITARGRCTARSGCRPARGRRSTCTTPTTRSTRWPRACARHRSFSRRHDALQRGVWAGTSRPRHRVGGGVMEVESLYQEIILDHYRHPHHKGLREPYDAQVYRGTPLCVDEVTLRVAVKAAGGEPAVTDVSYDSLGCSLSQARASGVDQGVGGTAG